MEEKEKTTMAKYTRSSSMAATITPIFIVVDAWSLPPRSKEVTEQRLSEITKNICKTEEYICWKLYNAYRMKTRHKGFGAPGYQIFDFKPFMFLLKNNKFWSACGLERMNSHEMTALTDCTS